MAREEKNDARLVHDRRARPGLRSIKQANVRKQIADAIFFIYQFFNLRSELMADRFTVHITLLRVRFPTLTVCVLFRAFSSAL